MTTRDAITMGEKISLGSDSAIMREAADYLALAEAQAHIAKLEGALNEIEWRNRNDRR